MRTPEVTPDRARREPIGWLALLLPLTAWAVLSLVQAAALGSGPNGGTDFHSYWFYGHFVWQGVNPYTAYWEEREPVLPIRYLDGVTVTTPPVAQPNLARTPANTAPMVLLLAPLARFSWPVARSLWLGCNLALIAAIPWLLVSVVSAPLTWRWQALITVIFWGMKSTRLTTWLGQTSLLVFALMLGALWWRKRNGWIAGVLLGVALAKYSLALPLVILFLWERRFRALAVALGVQGVGLFAVSSLAGDSATGTLVDYVQLMFHHTDLPGIHLGSLFGDHTGWTWVAAGLATLGVLLALVRRRPGDDAEVLPLLTALSMWTLLVAYHRSYDAILMILFVAAAVAVLAGKRLRRADAWLLSGFLIVSLAPPNLPGGLAFGGLLPGEFGVLWDLALERAITVAIATMLIGALWLLHLSHASHP